MKNSILTLKTLDFKGSPNSKGNLTVIDTKSIHIKRLEELVAQCYVRRTKPVPSAPYVYELSILGEEVLYGRKEE